METMERLGKKRDTLADDFGKGVAQTSSSVHEPDLRTSSPVGIEVEIHCRPGGRQPALLSREDRNASALDLLRSRKLLTNNRSNSHYDLDRPAMQLDVDVSAT